MFIGKEEFLVPPQPKANFLGAGMESETGDEADRPKSGMSKSKISKEHNSMTDENGPEKTPEERAREMMKPQADMPFDSGSSEDRAFRAVDAIIMWRTGINDPQDYGETARLVIAEAIREAEEAAEHRAYQRGVEDAARVAEEAGVHRAGYRYIVEHIRNLKPQT